MRAGKQIVLVALAVTVSACGASRKSGWEREQVKMEGDAAQVRSEADALWSERGTREKLEEAIVQYEKVAALQPDNLEVFSLLARAYYFLADAHYLGDKEKQIEMYDKGAAAGERALALDRGFRDAEDHYAEAVIKGLGVEFVPAMYWTASCVGKWGRLKGFTTLLKVKGKVKTLVEAVTEKDVGYFYSAPDRYWGVYYSVAPGFAGGDMNKSKEHFEKSIAAVPDYLGTKVLMADTYAGKLLDRALYEKLLNEVLAGDPTAIPEIEPENRAEQEKARRMMTAAEIEERFE